MRRVPGGVPGQDRHSASIAAPATQGCHAAVADAVTRGTADVAAVVVGDARSAALSATHVARTAHRSQLAVEAGKSWPMASRLAARTGIAGSVNPIVLSVVEEP